MLKDINLTIGVMNECQTVKLNSPSNFLAIQYTYVASYIANVIKVYYAEIEYLKSACLKHNIHMYDMYTIVFLLYKPKGMHSSYMNQVMEV